MDDAIEPDHYRWSGLEPIAVIEAWGLGFCLGNCLKYICRAGRKPGADRLEDLSKALWYLRREITRLERAERGDSADIEDETHSV